MLVLLAAEMNSTSGLGPVAAIGVAVAPAGHADALPRPAGDLRPLDLLAGDPALRLRRARPRRGLWARMGRRIARRPRTIWVVTALVLAALSLGLIQLRGRAASATRTPSPASPTRSSARRCRRGTSRRAAATRWSIVSNQAQAEQVGPAVAGDAGRRAAIARPCRRARSPPTTARCCSRRRSPTRPDSEAAKQTVERVRDAVHAVPDADAQVGGGTAALLDMDAATTHDNLLIIPLVLVGGPADPGGAAARPGRPAAADRRRWCCPSPRRWASARSPSATSSTTRASRRDFPLFVFVFLVALGIDYNIFLTTRIREEAAHQGTRRGRGDGPRRDRRGHHLGRPGPGRHLRRPRHAPDGRLRRDRLRGGPGRAPGHVRRAVGAGHGAVPGRGTARCGGRTGWPTRTAADAAAGRRSRGPAPTRRSAGPAHQRQIHGVRAVQMRPELDVGAVAQRRYARQQRPGVDQLGRDRPCSLEHVVDDRPGLGEVRRAGRVADDAADPYGLQRLAQQPALERREARPGPRGGAASGPRAGGAARPARCRARPSAPGRRCRAATAGGCRRRRSPGTGPGCRRAPARPARPGAAASRRRAAAAPRSAASAASSAALPPGPAQPSSQRRVAALERARRRARAPRAGCPRPARPARPSRTASRAPGSPPSASRTAYGDQRPGSAASSPSRQQFLGGGPAGPGDQGHLGPLVVGLQQVLDAGAPAAERVPQRGDDPARVRVHDGEMVLGVLVVRRRDPLQPAVQVVLRRSCAARR